jgi:MFS family permease
VIPAPHFGEKVWLLREVFRSLHIFRRYFQFFSKSTDDVKSTDPSLIYSIILCNLNRSKMQSVTLRACITLGILSFIYFLENYDRNLIAVSPIPYINYDSYKYSLLSGTLFSVVYTLGGLFFSLVRNLRKSRVYSIAFACIMFSVALFCTALASSFWQQAMIRMVMGLAQSVVTPFSSGIIGSHFDEKYRGIAFSIFNIGVYISFSLTLSLGTYMYDAFGWKMGYFVFGIVGVALGVCTPFLAHESGASDEMSYDSEYTAVLIPDNEKDGPPVERDRWESIEGMSTLDSMRCTMMRVLRLWRKYPALYVMCLATGLRMSAGYVWTAYTSVYFSELYVSDADEKGDSSSSSDCVFSYNETYLAVTSIKRGAAWAYLGGGGGGEGGKVCGAAYPYCFPSSGT